MEQDTKAKIFLGGMILSIIFIVISGPFINIHNVMTLLIQAFGILLIVWAIITRKMSKKHAEKLPKGAYFITSGPYEIIRHPIYAGILLIVFSLMQYNFNLSRTIAFIIFLGTLTLKIVREEYILEEKIKEYQEYKKKTKSLIPYLF